LKNDKAGVIIMNVVIEFAIKLIIALPLAFWIYRDARGRDYSWLFWTITPFITILSPIFLAILFPLIILAVYLMLRPKGQLISCPHCKKKIHDILTVCPFCRKEAKRECLACHEPVPWNAEQCPFCKSRALTKG
jgi:RNA polymerase subunit RPABC4/transcription elongation factor Spt4